MSANKHNIAALSDRLTNLADAYKEDVAGVIEEAKRAEIEPAALRRLVGWKRMDATKRAEREAIDDQYRFLAGELPTPATLPPNGELATAVRMFGEGMTVRQVAEAMEIAVGKAHKLKTQAAAFMDSVHVHVNVNTPKMPEMVAGDLGEWLPPHDTEIGEILAEEITSKPKPASILPSPEAWQGITLVREAHHAAIEAAREAKRLEREQDRKRMAALAALTDNDMPDPPPFLIRAQAGRGA